MTRPHRLSPIRTQWVESNWKWTDLSDDEHRCLWVMDQALASAERRFYHLPQPAPQRLRGGGFMFPAPGTMSTIDDSILTHLVVAAHAAAVRAEVRSEQTIVWINDGEALTVGWANGGDPWDAAPAAAEMFGWADYIDEDDEDRDPVAKFRHELHYHPVVAVTLTPRVPQTGARDDLYNAHPTIGDLSTLVDASTGWSR